MTKEQLKALSVYVDSRIYEMVQRYNNQQPTPQGSKARARAFAKVLEEFGISEEEWKK